MIVSRLKELCKLKGVTFVQFERESGLGEHTVNRWDKNSPSVKKVQIAAEYFGVSVSDILGDAKNPASTNADGISEKLSKLSPALRKQFVRFLALAKEDPDRAARYLAFLVQELEDRK